MNDCPAPNIKLDLIYPYSEYLRAFNVPKEKHGDFYERFGHYLYSESTPESDKEAAFRWMRMNRVEKMMSKSLNEKEIHGS